MSALLQHAEDATNPDLFESVVAELRDKLAGNPRAAGFLTAQSDRLAKIKAAAEAAGSESEK